MVIQLVPAAFLVSTVTWEVSSEPERNLAVLGAVASGHGHCPPLVSVHAILYFVACGQTSFSPCVKVGSAPLEVSDSFSAWYHFSSARVLERHLKHRLWIRNGVCGADELRLNLCHGTGMGCYLEGSLCLAAAIGLLG